MSIDWNKPIRTVGSHHSVTVLSRDWKKPCLSSEPLVAVSMRKINENQLFLYHQDGSPVHNTDRLENIPETRYMVLNHGIFVDLFKTFDEARRFYEYSRCVGSDLKIYKINLNDSIPM